MNVIEIAILILTALALAFFVAVFVDVARAHRTAKRRGCDEVTEEELAYIRAMLCELERMGYGGDKPKEEKKEEGDEKDKAL